MPNAAYITGTVYEDASASIIARVLGLNGVALKQADVSTITYAVTNVRSGTSIATGTLTISAVVFDTLQTGGPWSVDVTGYNFLHNAPGTFFPDGGETVQIDYTFTMSDASIVKVAVRPKVLNTYTD